MFGQSLLSAFGSAACTTDTDQLFTTDVQTTSVATYQLNNATTSIPSNTYPGIPTNITYAAGKFGNAAVFNGSNTSINIGASNNFASNKLTISFWANPGTGNSSNYQLLFSNYIGGTLADYDLNIYRTQGTQKMEIGISGAGSPYLYVLTDSAVFTNNVWKNYVIVFDTTQSVNVDKIKIYVDGSLVARTVTASSGTVTGSLLDTSDDLLVGDWPHDTSHRYSGIMDQVRIFNSALPQAAVTALYNETTTTATYPYVDYVNANPNSVAYYKMSDATDQLGNYNGTATNVNFNTEGKFGFAGAFNGSSSKILLPNSSFQTAAFTISAWCDVTANGSENSIFEFTDTNSGNNQSVILLSAGSTSQSSRFLFRNRTSNEYSYGPSGTPLSGWNHYCMTFDGSTVKSYINGSQVNSASFSITNTIASTSEVLLGLSAGDRFLNGKIDQIRIYNSAASAANVTALYNEIECPAVAVTNAFNAVLYTGNNSTQSITGVGFQPDFVWIKSRSAALSNVLHDTLTQPGLLISNGTNALINNGSNTVDFTSNGFNLQGGGSHTSVNGSGDTYVSWNWKAPLANLSTGFNGSSSGITSSSLGTALNVSSLSFSLWFKTNLNDSTDRILISSYDGSGNARFYASLLNSGLSVVIYGSSSTYIQNFINTVTTETWYHLSVTHTGTTTTVYLNGTAITPSSTTGSPVAIKIAGSPQPLTMGQLQGNIGTYDFNGSLDQVRIFDNALSSSEVTTLYEEPAASNNTLNYPAGAGCIAAYPLQTDAVDLSGNYSGASSNVTFGQPGYLTQNTDGTITSTVSANVDAGFSIVSYTGASGTVGHGLDSTPEIIIQKKTNGSEDWYVYFPPGVIDSNYNYMVLNSTASKGTTGSTPPTTTTFNPVSSSGNYIAYAFHSIAGYSRIGSYTWSNTSYTAGTMVAYLGFTPRFVMIKRTNGVGNWQMYDSSRGATSGTQQRYALYADNSDQENTSGYQGIGFDSDGFSAIVGADGNTTGSGGLNENGGQYLYLAIA